MWAKRAKGGLCYANAAYARATDASVPRMRSIATLNCSTAATATIWTAP